MCAVTTHPSWGVHQFSSQERKSRRRAGSCREVFYLKIPAQLEKNVLLKSGHHKPVFINKLAKDLAKQQPVRWFPSEEPQPCFPQLQL